MPTGKEKSQMGDNDEELQDAPESKEWLQFDVLIVFVANVQVFAVYHLDV